MRIRYNRTLAGNRQDAAGRGLESRFFVFLDHRFVGTWDLRYTEGRQELE
jgi:hypothetical protein